VARPPGRSIRAVPGGAVVMRVTAVVTCSSNDKQVTLWIHDDVLSIFEGKPAADATAFTIAYLQTHA
jgi:hypothetical protein